MEELFKMPKDPMMEWLDKMNELAQPLFEEMRAMDGGSHTLTGIISWHEGELIFSTCRALEE